MVGRASLRGLFPIIFSLALSAQNLSIPIGIGGSSNMTATSFEGMRMDGNLWRINGQTRSPLETANGSLSKLDLKAPGKARREYDKGYQLLMRKDLQGAVQHLASATSIYPSFVAAHNALGSAYLGLGQNDHARAEFVQAVALDDHLPTSYLNLGCAEMALKHFPPHKRPFKKLPASLPSILNCSPRWPMDS